jgi:hypothetical protein
MLRVGDARPPSSVDGGRAVPVSDRLARVDQSMMIVFETAVAEREL